MLDQMGMEMEAAEAAPAAVKKKLIEGILGGQTGTEERVPRNVARPSQSSGKSAPAAAPAAAAPVKVRTPEEASKLDSGTEFIVVGGPKDGYRGTVP